MTNSSTPIRQHLRNLRQDHDLEPARGRNGLERREAARRHVGELQVLRHGEVPREADAGLCMLRSSFLLLLQFAIFLSEVTFRARPCE